MKLKARAAGAAVVLSVAAVGVTIMNNPDVMKGFINTSPQSGTNYDDGSEKVVVSFTWGKGQLALGHITVNGNDFLKRTLDNITEKGGSAPKWTLRPNKGDKIEAVIVPHLTTSGSTCGIVDPKHTEAIKPPAVVGNLLGGSHCTYTVLG